LIGSANTGFYSLANLGATKNLLSHILSVRKYKIMFVVTAIAFAFFYMFATGILFYSSEPISEFIRVPHFTVIWPGDIMTRRLGSSHDTVKLSVVRRGR